MNPRWIALVDNEPRDAILSAPVEEGGWLAVWDDQARAPATAWRVDPRIVGANGAKTAVALAAAPPGVSIPFDDPAVTGAIRSALSSEPASICSALMSADGRYAGTLIAPAHLGTPFATIFPVRTLTVGAGVLKPAPWPTGPGTQRYGSEHPWPAETKL